MNARILSKTDFVPAGRLGREEYHRGFWNQLVQHVLMALNGPVKCLFFEGYTIAGMRIPDPEN